MAADMNAQHRAISLGELAAAVPGADLIGDAAIPITGIAFDSRLVRPGELFVALRGLERDGTAFVPDALARGAAAVAVERRESLPAGCSGLVVPYARLALGLLSACFEGWPARRLRVIGVTGTDGKTTTASLIASILRAAGRRVGAVTTVHADIGGECRETGLHTTTPDAPELQRYLRLMVEGGVQDVVLEVTSHALVQERIAGCDVDLAVITNVTGDHLDLHGTFEAYLAAKLRLFEGLTTAGRKPGIPKAAVYNLDDCSARPIAAIPVDRRLSYALEREADVRAVAVRFSDAGSQFEAQTPVGRFPVSVPLPGWYNVANALAAISTALLLDVPIEAIQAGIASFAGVPGRMERVDRGQDFEVFIDFAHTPHSLEQVLTLQRERGRRGLAVVFGCAGLRDRSKRRVMGAIAGRLADRIYLTAEDPRTESLEEILEAIAEGCREAGRREGIDFWKIPDRRAAIRRAVEDAGPGDIILVTGKGHERSMCFGETEVPWSDREVVEEALDLRLGRRRE